MELPTHCYDCGVYLMGGATIHKPDCEVQRLIDAALAGGPEPTSERSVLRLRTREHSHPQRKGEAIVEVVRDGAVVATIYGSREGLHITSARFGPDCNRNRPFCFYQSEAMPLPSWVLPLLAEGESCPWCAGRNPRCPVCGVTP